MSNQKTDLPPGAPRANGTPEAVRDDNPATAPQAATATTRTAAALCD